MKKRKFGRVARENPHDNPLGIGLSTKTLVLIGVGLVGVIALKLYMDRKKRAAGASPAVPNAPPINTDPIGLGIPSMSGVSGHSPASTNSPASPPIGSPSSGTAPATPPSGYRQPSRANYEGTGGFSGLGDGGLNGANSRM